MEAIAAGALPVLPNRLAYPEILAAIGAERREELLYDGTVEGLAGRLTDLAEHPDDPRRAKRCRDLARSAQQRFCWQHLIGPMDDALAEAAGGRP